jgi:hypothetical protein
VCYPSCFSIGINNAIVFPSQQRHPSPPHRASALQEVFINQWQATSLQLIFHHPSSAIMSMSSYVFIPFPVISYFSFDFFPSLFPFRPSWPLVS